MLHRMCARWPYVPCNADVYAISCFALLVCVKSFLLSLVQDIVGMKLAGFSVRLSL